MVCTQSGDLRFLLQKSCGLVARFFFSFPEILIYGVAENKKKKVYCFRCDQFNLRWNEDK